MLQLEGRKDNQAWVIMDVCRILGIDIPKLEELRKWDLVGDPDDDNPPPSFD